MDSFTVLYQDDQIIVINKPADLVVSPTVTQSEPTLADLIHHQFGIDLERAGIVHRLDKDTSGVIVVARTQSALEHLQAQFKARTTKKEYLALVHGQTETEFEIDGPIGRNPQNREKFIVTPDGKPASTKFSLIQPYAMTEATLDELFPDYNKIQRRKLESGEYRQFSYLRCFPLTGRTHQLRVHLKHLDHPIVGDERYGGRKTTRLDHRWCPRQFLHAAKLSFTHPDTDEQLTFEAELPADLQQVLTYLSPTT